MKIQITAITLTGCGLLVILSGCTHRDTPPLTPVENSATPTYRSVTNSYELNTAPRYTQSGIDGGQPSSLPAISSTDKFSQNTSLAFAVYDLIHSSTNIDSRYITVFSKGGTIQLTGTLQKSELKPLLELVRSQPGVKAIQYNQLQLQ